MGSFDNFEFSSDDDCWAAERAFYTIPKEYRVRSDEPSDEPDGRFNDLLTINTPQPASKPKLNKVSKETTAIKHLQLLELTLWATHLKFLDLTLSHSTLLGQMFSLYRETYSRPYLDSYRVYRWFVANFSSYRLPKSVWLLHNEQEASVLYYLNRFLLLRRGPSRYMNMLLLTLYRALRIPSRLVLHIPPSELKTSAKSIVDCLVRPVPTRLLASWAIAGLPIPMSKGDRTIDGELTLEVFWPVDNNWVPVDVMAGFDFLEGRRSANQLWELSQNQQLVFTVPSKFSLLTAQLSDDSESDDDEDNSVIKIPFPPEHPQPGDHYIEQAILGHTFSSRTVRFARGAREPSQTQPSPTSSPPAKLFLPKRSPKKRPTSESHNMSKIDHLSLKTHTFVISIANSGMMADITEKYHNDWSAVLGHRLRAPFAKILMFLNTLYVGDERKFFESFEILDKLRKKKLPPLPKAKTHFLKHPNYALESQLKTNEFIWPKEKRLGFFAGEPVWPRESVKQLYSEAQWEERFGRSIRTGEEPLKLIKRRGAADDDSQESSIGLYGEWQTEPQVRRIVDGKIPKTKYGNVSMIGNRRVPEGCIYLKGLPGILYVVREITDPPLEDYAPALVSFDFSGGQPKAVIDGVVIREEDRYRVLQEYRCKWIITCYVLQLILNGRR